MNWILSESSLSILPKRSTFASSRGASTSSRMQSGEGLLTAREEVDVPELFPRGLCDDVDPSFEDIGFVGEHQLRLPPSEEVGEDLGEFRVQLLEGVAEFLPRGAVDLGDGLLELGDRTVEVFLLSGKEFVPAPQLFVLFERPEVYRSQLPDLLPDI